MYKILIVDDEPFILEGLADIVHWEEHGLEISGLVYNGLEAKNIIDTSDINILITDIRMPQMDGLQLIRYVRSTGKNIKCIVLSGYNDFEYVKEAAKLGIENYLLKPVDEKELVVTLINTVNKIEDESYRQIEIQQGFDILRDNILLRWVSGDISSSELREKSNFINIDINNSEFITAIVKIAVKPSGSNEFNNDEDHIRYSVRNTCNGIVHEKGIGTAFIDSNDDVIILFSAAGLEQRKCDIKQILADCMENINTLLKVKIFITVGNLVKDYKLVFESYKHGKALQDYCLLLGYNQILFYDETIKSYETTPIDLESYMAILDESLKYKNINSINMVIDDIFEKLGQIEISSPSIIQNVSVTILFNMVNTIQLLNSNTYKVFEGIKDLLSSVYRFENINDLKNWLKETSVEFISAFKEVDEKISPLTRKTIEYIKANYYNSINLKTVASKFNVNAFYLGQLFKNETGETFTNYLNRLRIEKAVKLLGEGCLKINEIAEEVGYINTNYFFTIFKKITGMSPLEFKGD